MSNVPPDRGRRGSRTGLSRLHSLEFYKRKEDWILGRERSPSPDAAFDCTKTIEPTISKLYSPPNWRLDESSSSNSRMSTDFPKTTDDQTMTGGKTKYRGRSMQRRSDHSYYNGLNRTYSLDEVTMDRVSEACNSSVGSVMVDSPIFLASRSTSVLDSEVLSASFLHRSLEELTDEATFARQAALRPHSSQMDIAHAARATYASIAAQMKKDLESLDMKPAVKPIARSTNMSGRLSVKASANSDDNKNKIQNNTKLNVEAKPFQYSKEALYTLNKNEEIPKSYGNVCDNPDECNSELKKNHKLLEFFTPPGFDLKARQHMEYDTRNLDHVGNEWRMPNRVEKMAWVCDAYEFASSKVNWENDKTCNFAISNNLQSDGEHCQMLQVETGFCNNYENLLKPGLTQLRKYKRYVDVFQNAEKISNINVQDQNGANQEFNTPYDSQEYLDEYFDHYDCFPKTFDLNHPQFNHANINEGYDTVHQNNNVMRENVLKKITVQYGGREISFIDEYTDRNIESVAPRIDLQNDQNWIQNQNQHENVLKKITAQYGGREIFIEEYKDTNIESVAARIDKQNDPGWIRNQNQQHEEEIFIDEYKDRKIESVAPRMDEQHNQNFIHKQSKHHEDVLKKVTEQYGEREIFIDKYKDRNIEPVAPRMDVQHDQNWIQNQNLPRMHQAFPNYAQHWPNQRFNPDLGRGRARGMRGWLNTPEPSRKEVYP